MNFNIACWAIVPEKHNVTWFRTNNNTLQSLWKLLKFLCFNDYSWYLVCMQGVQTENGADVLYWPTLFFVLWSINRFIIHVAVIFVNQYCWTHDIFLFFIFAHKENHYTMLNRHTSVYKLAKKSILENHAPCRLFCNRFVQFLGVIFFSNFYQLQRLDTLKYNYTWFQCKKRKVTFKQAHFSLRTEAPWILVPDSMNTIISTNSRINALTPI